MDDKATVLRFPAATKDFSLIRRIQTGSGAYPVSYTMGRGGSLPGYRGTDMKLATYVHILQTE